MAGKADLAIVAALKAGIGAIVLATGFRAVSDDDFARVVIAEQWAHAPRLDPSGTSWLPAPFWLNGAVLLGAGRSLELARGTAFLLGILAAVVIHRAALWLTGDGRAALLGALIACAFPWSARLGVATVPELPAAALALLALASLAGPLDDPPIVAKRRLWGGLALLGATLSRYELWPLAAGFAALSLLDLRRAPFARPRILLAASLALLGPALWIAWNAHAHGDAFHFVARVTAFRKALGGEEPGAFARLAAYPLALLREEPELSLLLALGLGAAFLLDRAGLRALLQRASRPLLLVLLQIAALSFAMVKDGAPTHHPERAVLTALLLAALLAGDLVRLLTALPRRRLLLPALGALAVLGAIAALLRPRLPSEGFSARLDEVAAGRLARATVPAGETLLLEVVDYGHLAVIAALGRPEDAILDRSIDPRDPRVDSAFTDASALQARIATAKVSFVLARSSDTTREVLGAPLSSAGSWAIWRAPASP